MDFGHPSRNGDFGAKPDPDYTGFRITSIWAWTAVGPDDQEGIVSMPSPDGPVPMIASDRIRLDCLRPYAEAIGKEEGLTVKLRKFVAQED